MKNLGHVYSLFNCLGALLHELDVDTLEVFLYRIDQVSQLFERVGGFFMTLFDDQTAPFHIFL